MSTWAVLICRCTIPCFYVRFYVLCKHSGLCSATKRSLRGTNCTVTVNGLHCRCNAAGMKIRKTENRACAICVSLVCEPPTRVNGNNLPRRIKRTWKFLKRFYAQHHPLAAAVTHIHTGCAESYNSKVCVAYYEG